ncbi:hypothetical protein THAOC_28222, partial [Thalassiosira oceanica]
GRELRGLRPSLSTGPLSRRRRAGVRVGRKDREDGGEDSRILRRLIGEATGSERCRVIHGSWFGMSPATPTGRPDGTPGPPRVRPVTRFPASRPEHVRHILSLASRLGKDPGETTEGDPAGEGDGGLPRAPRRDRAQPVRPAGLGAYLDVADGIL